MLRERKLFGVLAGGKYESFLGTHGQFDVDPSREMLKAISELPRGTKVSIESLEDRFTGIFFGNDMIVDGKNVLFDNLNENYWYTIYELCKKKGLQPVFLDSLYLHIEVARKKIKMSEMGIPDSDFTAYARLSQNLPEHIKRDLLNYGNLKVEAEYIHDIGRYEHMLKVIKEEEVDVVIMSTGFAEYVAQDSEKLAEEGINFTAFYQDVPNQHFKATIDNMPLVMQAKFSEVKGESYSEKSHRELLLRKYRAYKESRVTESGSGYIGSFYLNCPPEGFFEIHFDDPNSGQIKDVIGDAWWMGEFDSEKINIIKYYDKEKSGTSAISAGIRYTAKWNGEFYDGIWDSGRFTGKFRLYKASKYPIES